MRKLSDYRIREENGKFYIDLKQEWNWKTLFGQKRSKIEWVKALSNRRIEHDCPSHYIPRTQAFPGYAIFDTLEAAKAQIIKWCEEPKYHYVREFERYTYNLPKICPWDLADFYKESLSRADIEYLAKCRAEKEKKSSEIKGIVDAVMAQTRRTYEMPDGYFIFQFDDIAKTEQQMKEELTTDDIRKLIEEQIKAAFEQMPLLSEKEMAEMKEQTDRNIEEMKQKRGEEKKPNK